MVISVNQCSVGAAGGSQITCHAVDEKTPTSQELISVGNVPNVLRVIGEGHGARGRFDIDKKAVPVQAQLNDLKVTKGNAKEVLAYLKMLPKSENTIKARLECLKADQAMDTWLALTYPSNEEMVAQKGQGAYAFKEFLGSSGVWLPEIENINHNIINNLLVRFSGEYSASFVELMLGGESAEARDIMLARGTPCAGKTSYLAGNFAIAADDAKSMLMDRIPGSTNDQVHFQGTSIIQKFEQALQEKFLQVLTSDALYLTIDAIENKFNALIEAGRNQKVSVRDVQVDLVTLCCRMLKRGGNEPKISFDTLGGYVKSSLVNRQKSIELVEQNKVYVKDYSFSAWDGERYVQVARFCHERGTVVAVDETLFEQYVTSVGDDFDIEKARSTVINADLWDLVVDGLEAQEANRFLEALKRYEGMTLGQALNVHARQVDVELSVAARVLKDVLIERY